MTLGGLVFGIAASFVVASIFVAFTYSCDAGPCDAGSYVGAGLAIILAPFLSAIFAVMGYRLAMRYGRRRAA